MNDSTTEFERKARKQGFSQIAGVDEVGRGPLAGPVVSAAVILPPEFAVTGVTDSKRLSPGVRERLYDEIYAYARAVGIGIVDPVEIDRINIFQASLAAMCMAVANLAPAPDCLLIDGGYPIDVDIPQKTITKGDVRSLSIAAASIVAKVSRDRMMEIYGREFPEYGFPSHKGYPTKEHTMAIRDHGWCPIHRRSFKGVWEHPHRYYNFNGSGVRA